MSARGVKTSLAATYCIFMPEFQYPPQFVPIFSFIFQNIIIILHYRHEKIFKL